jgi:teichuronic acid biosynthesis glycosyltransferase TuaC
VNPTHGIFVETRLRQLLASGEVESRVIAPVPWFPSRRRLFGRYAAYCAIPKHEVRHRIDIAHPRYLLLPKIGMTSAPFMLACAAIGAARRLVDTGYDFDLIDAHYFYPDGIAAISLGRAFGKPVVITGRGSDINLIPRHSLPRRMILSASRDCAALITVSSSLKEKLVSLGVESDKITVLRNGVDLTFFQPEEREGARAKAAMSRFTLLSVGNLVGLKGHHLVISALVELPDVDLILAGAGPEEAGLRRLAQQLGVADRVRFVGSVAQERLRTLYSGADALVLASSREGWPNVLLESMACGTPVVATRVGGIPEVVAAAEAGILMDERNAASVAKAIHQLRSGSVDRAATRRYAERFSWDATTRGQLELFARVLANAHGRFARQPACVPSAMSKL